MPSPKRRAPRAISLNPKVAIEVRPVPFRQLDSLRHLDLDRLARAKRARVELGYFEAGCCRRTLTAIVRNGIVTALEVEPCPNPVRLTAGLRALVRAARRAIEGHSRRPRFRRQPVREFFGSDVGLTIDVSFCFLICLFGYCLICCYDRHDPVLAQGCDFFRWVLPP
jgi:hypothetical protein